jgi:hypothetical protein
LRFLKHAINSEKSFYMPLEILIFRPGHKWEYNIKKPCKVRLLNIEEGKRPLGRLRPRILDNIKMDLREIGCDEVDWMIWLRIGTSGGLL